MGLGRVTATVTAEPAGRTTDPDDGHRTYPYPPTGEPLDSVTTIIGGTDAKRYLNTWAAAVAIRWVLENLALVWCMLWLAGRDGPAAVVAYGKEESKRIRELKAEAGKYVHDVQEALIYWAASPGRTGTMIDLPILPGHLEDADYDLGGGKSEPLADVVDWMITGFCSFVSDFGPQFEATEMAVYSIELRYAGTLDMIITLTGYALSIGTGPRGADEVIACPGSVLVICVDTKTGRAAEGTWKEQLAAYRRATECLLPLGDMHPMPRTDCAAVLHLRPDYPGGYLLMLVSAADDEAAWDRFRMAATIFRERQAVKDKPGTVIRPLRADGTMPGPRVIDLRAEGYGLALAPLIKAFGARVELEDVARFTAAELLTIKGIGDKLIITVRQMLADHGLHLAEEETTTDARKAA
jgi:hypothetical protein